jgi:hypothetical protein
LYEAASSIVNAIARQQFVAFVEHPYAPVLASNVGVESSLKKLLA